MTFIDTHAHIYMDRFEEDLDKVIHNAGLSYVTQILMPNIDVSSMKRVMSTHERFPEVCKPMVGLHPCSVNESWAKDLKELEAYLDLDSIVAIGEIGIDLYWDKTFGEDQEKAFIHQINWAKDLNLPIVIHSRAAIDISIKIVESLQDGNLQGVFHCFDQSLEHAKQIVDLGFFMGLGGVITYKKNKEIRSVVREIPLSSFILETDAPFLPPVPYRGKRNESSYIPIIAKWVSDIKDISIDEVGKISTENAKALFSL